MNRSLLLRLVSLMLLLSLSACPPPDDGPDGGSGGGVGTSGGGMGATGGGAAVTGGGDGTMGGGTATTGGGVGTTGGGVGTTGGGVGTTGGGVGTAGGGVGTAGGGVGTTGGGVGTTGGGVGTTGGGVGTTGGGVGTTGGGTATTGGGDGTTGGGVGTAGGGTATTGGGDGTTGGGVGTTGGGTATTGGGDGTTGGGVGATGGGTATTGGGVGTTGGGSGALALPYFEDFETSRWTLNGLVRGSPVSGPGAAFAGTSVLATNLTGEYVDDLDWGTTHATSPAIDLTGVATAQLGFNVWYNIEANVEDLDAGFDGFNVKVSTDNGATFNLISSVTPAYQSQVDTQLAWSGIHEGWQYHTADLTPYVGQTVMLRVEFRTDPAVTRSGLYIDDLLVTDTPPLVISSSTLLPRAFLNEPWSASLTAVNAASVTWSIVSDSSGQLSIDPVTGVLSGTLLTSGTVTVTVRAVDTADSTRTHQKTFTFPATLREVGSIEVTGLPSGFLPGWGFTVQNNEFVFSVTTATTSATGTQPGGIGFVPVTGGAYTESFPVNQATGLDPQFIFFDTLGNLNAFNGVFTSPQGTAGLYSVSGGAATALTTTATPYVTTAKYGYASLGDNLFLAVNSSAGGILGANSTVSASVPFTQTAGVGAVTTGVAASASKLFVFGNATVHTLGLSQTSSPSVPVMTAERTDFPIATSTPCSIGSTRKAIALDNKQNPTRIFYTTWGATAGSTTSSAARICEVQLDNYGFPAKVNLVAGPTTNETGSVDGAMEDARFEFIRALTYDESTQTLYALQRENTAAPGHIIRFIRPRPVAVDIVGAGLPEISAGASFIAPLRAVGGEVAWSIPSDETGALGIDPVTGVVTGSVGLPGSYQVTVRAESVSNPSNFDEAVLTLYVVSPRPLPYEDGFEADGGWRLTGDWERGTPTTGPSAARTGTGVLATNVDGSYSSNVAWGAASATSPLIDLTSAPAPQLRFYMWYQTETTADDAINVKVTTDDGATWSVVTGVTPAYTGLVPATTGESAWYGSANAYSLYTVDLTPYSGNVVRFRFDFRSDSATVHPGFYIDDLGVYRVPPVLIVTNAINYGMTNTPYSATIQSSGGNGVTWSIVSDTSGALSIDPVTGELSGTPTTAGVYSVTVRVTDNSDALNFYDRAFSWTVYAAANCGDGQLGFGEQCDDGTLANNDGCDDAQVSPGVPGPCTVSRGYVYDPSTGTYTATGYMPPLSGVNSMTVSGVPAGFFPGPSLWREGENFYFPVTNGANVEAAGTVKSGIGRISNIGGTYIPFVAPDHSMPLDPQAVFFVQGQLYAFSGLFTTQPGNVHGIYRVTDPLNPVQVASAPSGEKAGWSVSGSNFFVGQGVSTSPYDAWVANVTATVSTPMVRMTTASTPFFYGAIASATKLYHFGSSSGTFQTWPITTPAAPGVPTTTGSATMIGASNWGAGVCNWGGNAVAAVFDDETAPTRIYYTIRTTNAASATSAVNRICMIPLDASGTPTAPPSVFAGPTTGIATPGSVDSPQRENARFESIQSIAYEQSTGLLYVLQRVNSTNPNQLIRVISTAP